MIELFAAYTSQALLINHILNNFALPTFCTSNLHSSNINVAYVILVSLGFDKFKKIR